MTVRSPVAVLAVAVLVVAAGCSGFGGGTTPDRQPYEVPPPTPTETTTPTETATPTETPVRTVVPGIASDRVVSALDAMRSHGLALLNRSFEVTRSVTVRYPNGSVAERRTLRAWVDRSRTEYLVVRDRTDARPVSVYADGRTVLSRTDRSGGTEYELLTPPGGQIPDPGGVLGTDLTYTSRIYLYVDGMNDVSVSDVPDGENGTARYQIASNDVDNRSIDTVSRGTIANVSVVVVTNERGLVEEMWGIYTRVEDGQALRVFERIEYDNVGTTTVPTPEWVAAARNATGTGD